MKKTVRLAIFLIFVVSTMTGCVGTYFVNFALARQSFNPKVATTKTQKKEDSQSHVNEEAISKNGSIIKAEAKHWFQAAGRDSWTVTSSDGLKLEADFFPVNNSHKYAVLVHGYTANRSSMYPNAMYYARWGFNVLTPDNRSHGKSEGKYIGMGWLDSQDLLLWINKIVEKDPEAQITLMGVSMGGATVMMSSGLDLPDNVKCIVEDCGYSSVWDEFADRLKATFGLPTWPVLNWANRACNRLAGYDLKEASSVDMLSKTKIPMLFIHGTEDDFVNYSMLDENVEAIGDVYHEVLRVKGAGHATSLYVDPETYVSTVKTFTERFID